MAAHAAQLAAQAAQLASRDAQLASRDAQLASRDAQLASRDAQLAAQATQLASRDAQLASHIAELAASRRQLELPGARAAKLLRACREDCLVLRPPRPAQLDDVLQYVAATRINVSAQAFGLSRAFWRDEEQMHWPLAKARYGARKMTRLMWACMKGLLPRVVELIAWSSDVDAQDERGMAPLHFASEGGHL